jgi:hypothetical protein
VSDYASSVQGVALRVCTLDATGAPLVGTGTGYVTNAFMSLGWTPEYEAGQEITEKAADGSVCINYQEPDVLKRVTLSLAICAPEPELTAILNGGTLLSTTGSSPVVVGYASPDAGEEGTPNGVGIEVWSRAIVGGKPATVRPYWRWVFPYAKLRLDGERRLENGAMANTFAGWGLGNSVFDTGPGTDWLYSSSQPFQYARDTTFPSTQGPINIS